jgi:hypothetical protein
VVAVVIAGLPYLSSVPVVATRSICGETPVGFFFPFYFVKKIFRFLFVRNSSKFYERNFFMNSTYNNFFKCDPHQIDSRYLLFSKPKTQKISQNFTKPTIFIPLVSLSGFMTNMLWLD